MSLRQLEARIARLERAVAETKAQRRRLTFEFPIEPELAKALSNDVKRLDAHKFKRLLDHVDHQETPEEVALRGRIAQTAKTIKCPPSYGFKEFLDDQETMFAPLIWGKEEELLFWKHEFFIDNLDDIDAEKAQIVARMEAYKQTAEGQARFRLEELQNKSGWKSEDEHEEIERSMQRYPEPFCHPNGPLKGSRPSLRELKEYSARHRDVVRMLLEGTTR